MKTAVIVDSVRTGLAKSFRGGFNQTRADDMTAHLVNTLLERNPGLDPALVEDMILVAELLKVLKDTTLPEMLPYYRSYPLRLGAPQ